MSADSPRRAGVGGIGVGSGGIGGGGGSSGVGGGSRGIAVAATVPPQVVSDRSILDSAIGFINDVTLAHQPLTDPKDTITWARFESAADISDPRYGEDWELEGNVAPPLLLVLGYGLGVQVWAIPANGEAVEVLSWRHGIVSALRVLPTPSASATIHEHERADEAIDMYADKRPLIALVDGTPSSGTQPQFCAVNFISLKTGTQVKTIKFKNPVLDVLANRCSIVITFHERIAVFDARTLDDRLSITTCYPSPGINPNPVTLGPRWLAYAENKLLHSKRSGAGCDGEGVASYTATVLNAAKSLGKGLRELGEHVAAGLTGTAGSGNTSKSSSFESGTGPDLKHAGVVTILDVKHPIKDYSPNSGTPMNAQPGNDPIVAHFIAHSEALVAMEFDNSGMLLLTADRRGHDFHIFRIQPHSVGASLAAVHHLYVLHRGDTSAKVQNIAFSLDSRWVAVSTLRGTTHVFPITPYGGAMGVRTHTSLHVVNKLSRFHRSAGLSADGRSSSPISHSESTTFVQSLQPYHNPTLPPFPRPTVVLPLAQLRQPLALGSPPGTAGINIGGKTMVSGSNAGSSQRQRLSSLSDDNGKSLSVCAIFAKSRSWLLDPPNVTREAPHRMQRKAVDSLFVMAGHGALIQYDLDTKLASNVAKEKICDDTPIELEVAAKAQWNLGRRKDGSQELKPPLSIDNWLIKDRNSCMLTDSTRQYDDADDRAESWLSQVEIITHAGPHRRLWMGPQFVFKTYNTPSGSNLSHVDAEAVEIGVSKPTTAAAAAATSLTRTDRSSPLNMPLTATGRAAVPVLIESGSYSSIEQSPKLMDRFRHDHLDSDFSVAHGDTRLKEDLADAMRESPSVSAAQKDIGRLSSDAASSENIPFYDALTEHDHDNDTNDDDDDDQAFVSQRSSASVAALASALPNIYSYDTSSSYESLESLKHKQKISIEKVVNPLGTVTTVTAGMSAGMKTDILDEVVSQLATEDCVIHENCDEALFRPVVAIFCDDNLRRSAEEEAQKQKELCQPPEVIGNKLIVPVIAKEVDAELSRKEKEKTDAKTKQHQKKDDALGSCKTGTKPKAIVASIATTSVVAPAEIKRKESNIPPAVTQRASKEHVKQLVTAELAVDSKSEVLKTPQLDTKIASNKLEKIVTNLETKTTSKSNVMEKSSGATVITVQTEPTKKMQLSTGKKEEIKQNKITAQLRKGTEETDELSETPNAEDVKSTAKVCSKTAHDNIISSTSANTAPIIEKTLIAQLKTSTSTSINSMNLGTKSKAAQEKIEPVETAVSIIQEDEDSTINRKSEKAVTEFETSTRLTKLENQNKSQKSKVEEFSAPAKTGKSKKQKANASASSSDNDEVIPKRKSIDEDKKILSLSSGESSFADLSSSGLHYKTDEISSISVSFSKTKEKPDTKYTKAAPVEVISVKETIKPKPKEVEKNKTKTAKSQDLEKDSKISASKIPTEECVMAAKRDEDETPRESIKSEKESKQKISNIESPKSEKRNAEAEKKDIAPTAPTAATKKSLAVHKEESKTTKVETSEEPPILVEKLEKFSTTDLESKEKISKPEPNKSPKKSSSKQTATQEDIEITTTVTLPLSPNKRGVPKEKKQISFANEKETAATNTAQPNFVDTKKTVEEKKISSAATSSSNDETDTCEPVGKDNASKKYTSPLTTATPSVWKTVSGAEMISKNLDSSKGSESNFPSLGKTTKVKKSIGGKQQADELTKETVEISINDTLLPEMPISVKTIDDLSDTFGLSKSNKKLKKFTSHDLSDFPLLKPLDALPPLPVLEPLEVIASNTSPVADDKGRSYREAKDISLINFESPLQENPALERKITPPPRGFTEQNLILALCGSLHYENENPRGDKVEFSPTLSLTRSNSGIGEQSMGDYKSLTENDEPYMSLEQSSQDTNTTNTATTNEKFSSSPNSSASEDIVIVEEKKMTKKQRRKKMQIELENQKEKAVAAAAAAAAATIDVDEELRPLIGGMCDSFIDTYTDNSGKLDSPSSYANVIGSMLADNNYCASKAISCSSIQLGNSTNTEDSEGPMPATTSDDNVIVLSSTASKANVQHKLKTKKLEHKINLIAAIEAATSSSTSSAEESGMETSRRSPDLDIGNCGGGGALISVAATPVLPHQMASSVAIQQNVMKKKTKRRKR